jgi:hypothetical protein
VAGKSKAPVESPLRFRAFRGGYCILGTKIPGKFIGEFRGIAITIFGGGIMMLIQEKVTQAVGILKEQGIDCWITFVRESAINGDPVLEFLLNSEVTWHTAIIICASGETCTICGEYDRKTIEDTGAYQQVLGYIQGIREPFLAAMRRLRPSSIAIKN